MAQQMSVRLNKGDAPSLGFRLQGGIDFGTPLVIQKVNLGSPAEKAGLVVGDSLVKINGTDVYNLRHKDAQDVIIRAGPSFEITVQRGGTSTWKPSVTPLPKAATPTSFSPVTKTSLAAKPQPSIGSIGTGHNLSAKPFSPQLNGAVNGGPKLVNKQYNSPLGLYSEQSIAETLSAQAEVLSTGVLGVNFKKNEKNYDASNSAVFRMVHEADKEPRDQEPVNRQNFYATHSHAIGGYTTTPRSNTPLSERSNSRQGLEEHMQKPGSCDEQTTTCNECDRVIVGVFVRIKDKNLHVECFKCATCGSSLKNVGYYNINNKLYCDVHAKLAAKSAAPASNLVPVTVLPPGKAPAGTISAALATHPLPTVPPSSGSSNITAQPFQGGNFPSPRPFSSVSAPLSPPVNNYSTLPKASPTSPPFVPSAPAAQGHSLHNIIWPPPPNSEELELPTATPLYLPPPTHLKVLTRASIFEDKKDKKSLEISKNIGALDSLKTKDQKGCSEIEDRKLLNTEETHNVTRDMETRMSICSKEVTNITQRQLAVERIEAATETQSIVESVLQQRPKSPSPSDEYLQPKVKVETAALSRDDFSETLKCNIRASANSPRVVTKVCVCTNPCCEANNGELCENCPMKTVGKSKDDSKSKLKPTEIELPKRYGSPIITGVSVTINNPGKIKESATDLFTQIPEKKTTSALGSALVTTPKEPFIPASATYSGKSVPLPEATEPYLPPEKHVAQEEKPPKPRCIKTQEHDTPMVSALRIAPDQPFTPVNTPAPSKKKKPKEDPLLADLPKPKQWMSMVSALTTTPEKPFSLAVNESSTEKQTVLNKLEEEEVTKIKESQEKKSKSSIVNTTVLPKPFEQLKSKPVETSKTVPEVALLPTTTDLKSQYHYDIQQTQEKREMLSQRTEQSCLIKKECKEEHKEQKHEEKLIECSRISGKSEKSKKIIVEKQAEQTILKKPLELTNYLQKREYLPQYQMSLNYDETIQLPHHKDIKKLLPDGQSKQESKGLSRFATTQEWSKEATSSHFLSESTKQSTASTRPLLTVQDDTKNVFRPVVEDKLPSTSFSPRPKLLTPSVISNPAPILPYYQERLVPTQMPPPEINILDPKSPAVSRSPSPCPDRAPSPFKSPSPRPISPAPGPPPNPLRTGEVIPKFTKDYYKMENAKKSISEYIPHYREKVEGIECIKYPEKSPSNTHATSIKSYEGNKCYTTTALDSQTCMGVADVKQCIHSSKATDVSSLTEQNIEKLKKSTSEVHQTCSMFKVQNTNIAAVGNVNKHLENTQRASPSCTQLRQPLPESQCSTSNPEHTNIHHVNYSQSNTGPTVGSSVSTVPKPNTGSSGGRQPGAIGVTPKRGRGILNVGGLIGSRVAVCGHCHSQISLLNTTAVNDTHDHHHTSQTTEEKLSSFTTTINLPIKEVLQITDPSKVTISSMESDSFCTTKTESSDNPPLSKNVQLEEQTSSHDFYAGAITSKTLENPEIVKKPVSDTTLTHFEKRQDIEKTNKPQKIAEKNDCSAISTSLTHNSISFVDSNSNKHTNTVLKDNNEPVMCCVCLIEIKRGPFITALGKIWCPEHFICNTPSCRRQLQDLGFVEEQGQLYCEYCFEQYIAPPCAKCSAKIKGDCLRAIGKNFHPECFSCSYCGKLFGNSPFFLEDAQPYCENDWNELFTTKCFACGFPVEAGDRWVEALNNNYHSQCFNCTMCKKNLEGQSFFAKGGRPFCKNHAR